MTLTRASIHRRERANGTLAYRVMFRIDGKQVGETFDTLPAAETFREWVARFGGREARELRQQRTEHRGVTTLAEIFADFLEHSPGITDGTRAEYRRVAARSWLPTLGELPVTAIDRNTVARWINEQKKQITRRGTPTASKTLRNQHALLSSTLAYAIEMGLRPDNPAKLGRGLRLPAGQQAEMTFLTHDEFARVLTHVDPHWRPLLITLAGTGMRWGEATALQWSEVDLDSPKPTVRVVRAWKHGETQRVLGIPKTSRSRRTITLPEEVADVLRPLRGDAKPSDLVFRGPRSGQVHHQSFRRVWHAAVKASGIDKRPRVHDLRHSHVAWLIDAGRSLPSIQRRLGHEKISTTIDTYGHLSDDADSLNAAAISVALSQALPQLANPVEAQRELEADQF
jgi:integrase